MDMNRFKKIQHLSKQLTESTDWHERQTLEDEIETLEVEIEAEAEAEVADNRGGHHFI